MTLAALHIALIQGGVRVAPPAPLGVEAMVLGRSAEEAAEMLPRLFNLCRAAQETGARMALGLPARPGVTEALAQEILREHLMRLFVLWPRRLGLAPTRLPDADDLRAAVFGPAGGLPDPGGLDGWLASGSGVAPVLNAIARAFAPGEAVADLPAPRPDTLCRAVAQENSPWSRHRDAALLHSAEQRFGRGPLWRALGRLVDLDACARGTLDCAPRKIDGTCYVHAARGTYTLSARLVEGRVAAFVRHTPTEHLLAPGGALEQALAGLPPAKAHLAPLLVDILDPCLPVEITEAAHA
ncbi:hypothetical protein Ga0609869_000314 [Rhodovulum iodosum]|uniref:Hydrogenase expression/formation protein HupK n=1 Tax=Rhodovulum iodosum TaxID=68291 RepID=A0ABV3XNQ9_9RHOB|nr:HupK protein [Rhodovulum robiginosum]RSK34853.1 HupK protein [Rhodovulum robiginosum]